MNKKLERFRESVKGKNIAVIGIGISNTPLIKMLTRFKANVTAFDKKTSEQLGESYDELKVLGVNFSLGEDYLSNLEHDIIFKTPGMRFDIPELLNAKKKGCIITSEMEVFFDLCPAQIIGVTGSDGKTTTTTLIHRILEQEGYHCWLGGNIGKPLLSEIENIKAEDKVILELSSFQLHTMKSSPDIGVITNVTPNHLDIHKSMEEYVDAKKNIFYYQSEDSKLILNYDNEITKAFKDEAVGNAIFFSRRSGYRQGVFLDNDIIYININDEIIEIMNIKDIMLPGMHNVENYMAAIAAIWHMVNVNSIKQVATTFNGVEHRIEYVRKIDGVKFYNDSIASSPTRTMAGLNAFNQKVILIAGGYDKQIPFDQLGHAIVDKVKALVLIGRTADKIEKAVKDAKHASMTTKQTLPIIKSLSLDSAVSEAYNIAKEGDIIILSPACASFDLFKNFEDRGNQFKKIVKSLELL